ncbi:hypothetical protein PVAP13_2NG446503 [Panicum virgatum]|uniref:Uncharacterized protein n=1 Tax=Panicum virgatum TaxID=38727 RepID=A0A8T0VMB2_PANVG|nr:hypothetical protein PVAP13_2NG446503 [Panicum virgatum]
MFLRGAGRPEPRRMCMHADAAGAAASNDVPAPHEANSASSSSSPSSPLPPVSVSRSPRQPLVPAVPGPGSTARPPCPAKGAPVLAGHDSRASCPARGAGAAPGRRSSTRRAAGLRDRALSRDLGAGGERDGRPRVAWVSGRPARATPRPRVLARARCRAPAGRAAGACGGWSFVSARASPRLHARRCAIARGSRCSAED